MLMLCLAATLAIFDAGPTRIGLMIPASAASAVPRSEVSSQGCTTIVVTAGTAFAAAISRSYFEGRASPAACVLIAWLPVKRPSPADRKGLYSPARWNLRSLQTARSRGAAALRLRRKFRHLRKAHRGSRRGRNGAPLHPAAAFSE